MNTATDTQTASTNEALARAMVSAFLQGDLAAVREHFAEDATWDLPGRGVLAGTYRGPDAIIGFLARAFELSAGTLSLEVHDVLSSPTGACQVQRVTAELPGKRLDCIELISHEIQDGRIVSTHHRPDAHALDEFFG
jgi:ketosteroid isomerase-like protein